jgi:hypothetical protein
MIGAGVEHMGLIGGYAAWYAVSKQHAGKNDT